MEKNKKRRTGNKQEDMNKIKEFVDRSKKVKRNGKNKNGKYKKKNYVVEDGEWKLQKKNYVVEDGEEQEVQKTDNIRRHEQMKEL